MVIMKKHRNSIFVLSIIAFLLISLACGSSTAEQLASAVPDTQIPSQPSGNSPITEEAQSGQPTIASQIDQPTLTPSPQPEPISLISQGLGQDGQELGFGFVIYNPNSSYAYESSQYQIAVYNAEGTVIETDSSYIELILPGQQLGIGGTLYLDEGVTASRIDVQINAGEARVSDLSETFSVDKVTYVPDEYFPQVRGVILNPYNKDITDLRVSAILYDDAGNIIGGGRTYLNFIQANNTTGISLSVSSNGNISRVDLFPTISGLSDLASDNPLPEGASNLVLSKQGFGQDGEELGYGILVENQNQNYVLESTMYHVTAYGEDDTVLGVSEGYIDTILPGQILGIGDNMYLDQGVIVSRIDAQIKQGNFNAANIIPSFTAENATFLPDQYFPKVTGEIVSPYSKDVTNLRVTALAYNEAGDIIGGGYTYLDFIPANSKSAVSVSITVAGIPAKVELFATVSSLSDIEG